MKKTILILSIFVVLNAQAQSNIGINTANPDASSILDITHTTRGLLIPRIVLTATNVAAPILAPATSLLVYNTNTTVGVNGVTPGYYYWDGLQWASLSTPPTTNTLINTTNTITSTVDGVVSTAPAVNTVSNALTGSNLTTTVNGVAGAPVDLSTLVPAASTTNTLSSAGNTITSTVNSIAASAPSVNTVTNTSTANNLTTTVNGVAGTAVPIVNTISNTLTGTNLSTTVNGITGAVVNLSSIVPATTVSNTSSANNLTTTVNGVAGTAVPMVNTISNTLTGTNLSTTVNGITGAVVNLSSIVPATTVSNTSTTNNLTTTVNGVAGTTVPMVNSLSNTYNTTTGAFNTTVNGIAGANVTLPTNKAMGDSVRTLAWLTKGNAGTTAGTNFVGTTDAKDLVFKTNSIENMRILNTNGNVGIGTTTPNAKLYLRDNIPVGSLDLVMDNTAPSGQQWVFESIATFGTFTPGSFAIGNRTTSASPLVITPANNVGIGTVTPLEKLHVGLGNIHLDNNQSLNWNENSDGARITFNSTGDAAGLSALTIETIDNSDEPILFKQTGIERLRIHTNGFIGLGTATPTEKLEVQGSVKIVDGTEGLGRVLTSDATGKATWKEAAVNTNKFSHTLPYPASVAVSATGGNITLGAPFTITTTGIYRVLVDASIPQGMILGIDGAGVSQSVLYATVSNRYYAQYFVYITAGSHNLILYNDNNGALTNGGPYWNFYIEGPIN